MELTRWSPLSLSPLRGEFDNLFESFLRREPFAFTNGGWSPALDVAETPQEIVVTAELPGVEEKDVSVSMTGNHLMIKGERKKEEETKEKYFHRVERSYGRFERMIAVPATVDTGKISAEFTKGVLEVHLPKNPKELPKEIKVKAK